MSRREFQNKQLDTILNTKLARHATCATKRKNRNWRFFVIIFGLFKKYKMPLCVLYLGTYILLFLITKPFLLKQIQHLLNVNLVKNTQHFREWCRNGIYWSNDDLFGDTRSFYTKKETRICVTGTRCYYIQMINTCNTLKKVALVNSVFVMVLYCAKNR